MPHRLPRFAFCLTLGLLAGPVHSTGVGSDNVIFSAGITSSGAARAIAAAEAEAVRRHVAVAIVVIDDHGASIRDSRMDGAASSLLIYARRKAETALLFGSPTAKLATDTDAKALIGQVDGMLLVGGGVDLKFDGKTIGAIGVSGADPQTDAAIAEAAAAQLAVAGQTAPNR